MSEAPVSATMPGDAARWCRSAAARLTADADVPAMRAVLGGGGAGRTWTLDVPAGSSSPEGAARLRRELLRPVDPATGPAARSVVLRYADGSRDLVVVSHHAPDPALSRAAAPYWGLAPGPDRCPGYAAGAVAHGARPADVAVEPLELAGFSLARLIAALGIVLERYEGADRVRVGLHPIMVADLLAGPQIAVSKYLAAAEAAASEYLAMLSAGHGGQLSAAQDRLASLATRPGAADESLGPPVAGVAAWSPSADVICTCPFLAPPYPLSVALHPAGATLWYRPAEVAAEVAAAFARHLALAAHCLASLRPGQLLGETDFLGDGEQLAIAELGGLGVGAVTEPRLIHDVVRGWVQRTPEAIAVSLGASTLTYAELDERADQVARSLRLLGVRAGDRVGVRLERSPELVAVLLGTLRAGAAYVPIDLAWPALRVAFVARDAGLALLVTTTGAAGDEGDVADLSVPTVPAKALVGSASPRWASPHSARARPAGPFLSDPCPASPGPAPPGEHAEVTPASAAYVIYTSGSTGTPKGVVIAHGNVTRLIDATAASFGLGPQDTWTQFHSVAFDFSVWEIWGCLMTGGRLVMVPYRTSRSPDAFAALLAAEQVTVLSQTPSAFAQLLEADRAAPLPESLRLVIFGGEPLDLAPLADWLDRHPEQTCRLVNMYGITETTVHVTAQVIDRAHVLSGSRSVGRPLPGWHVHVRDRHGRPVPPGVAGEIYVGGAGVAGEYLGRPELTAERFVPDPIGGLLYRTGDLGRLHPDGRLDHLGRLDGQVQLRGHRVELGEVRARLLDAAGVRAAVVLARLDPADPLGARLDAYVVADAETHDVRRHAEAFLPDYMVPATVTRLPALPLTANGKVDLARLPEPAVGQAAAPADGSLASIVHAAWEQVFGFRVGADEDFFALGGNSLIAVRLLAMLHSAGLPRLAVPQLYRNRTVSLLVAALAASGAGQGGHSAGRGAPPSPRWPRTPRSAQEAP